MKRFWKDVEVTPDREGWTVSLDDRPIRTPKGAPFTVPTRGLANAIADEWRSVGEAIDPRALPLTGLANAAIDRIGPGREAFAEGLASYAEADLACYRAEGPSGLVKRQEEEWDALLAWARRRFDVDFVTTSGMMHVEQPTETVRQLGHRLGMLNPFRLAGISPLITIGGSLVAALAVLEKAITPEEAWDAVSIDERWQLEQWGSDDDAEAALEARRCDFLAAARFLELLES